MGILRDFESRLEGAVEGFFARAFRSGLQPVELAKALQRYMSNYQQVGVDGVFVPNLFRIQLSDDDYERFSGFANALTSELADVVRRTAAEEGWNLQGPVRVLLKTADHVREGTYELQGKVEAGPPEPPSPEPVRVVDNRAAAATTTTVVPTRGSLDDDVPEAWLHVLNATQPGLRFRLGGATIVGRLPECDISLDDPSVSRRHARLTRNAAGWRIEDLGSTNGVRVNGEDVGASDLRNGDRLELGNVRLVFAEE